MAPPGIQAPPHNCLHQEHSHLSPRSMDHPRDSATCLAHLKGHLSIMAITKVYILHLAREVLKLHKETVFAAVAMQGMLVMASCVIRSQHW